MRTLVGPIWSKAFTNTHKQMGLATWLIVSISGWVTYISVKTGVYFNQSKNILYHDYQQLVTFLTVQSLKNNNKQLSSYDQRKQYRSGKNLICHRIFDENLRKKQIKDGIYFLSKKVKIVRQEREKIKLYNDVIACEIGSVLAKRWFK